MNDTTVDQRPQGSVLSHVSLVSCLTANHFSSLLTDDLAKLASSKGRCMKLVKLRTTGRELLPSLPNGAAGDAVAITGGKERGR